MRAIFLVIGGAEGENGKQYGDPVTMLAINGVDGNAITLPRPATELSESVILAGLLQILQEGNPLIVWDKAQLMAAIARAQVNGIKWPDNLSPIDSRPWGGRIIQVKYELWAGQDTSLKTVYSGLYGEPLPVNNDREALIKELEMLYGVYQSLSGIILPNYEMEALKKANEVEEVLQGLPPELQDDVLKGVQK